MLSSADRPARRGPARETPRPRARRHLPAAGVFALLSLAWTFPLVLHLGTHIPGLAGAPGDNVCFVWNLWWIRTALSTFANPFHTALIFHPVGVDLTQHTHTALNGAIAATVLAPFSPIAAQNVLLLGDLFLNSFVAYLLAWRLTANRFAALAAGVSFGGSVPILIRLYGHFNLVGAWVIPLVVLAAFRALHRRSRWASLLAGGALAAAAYSDYYYLLYAVVLLAACLLSRWFVLEIGFSRARSVALSRLFAALVLLDVALMVAITVSGGFTVRLGPFAGSMRTTFNERAILWLLVAAWALARWRARVAARRTETSVAADVRLLGVSTAAFVLGVLPLVVGATRLALAHEYTSPHYGWRSAPAGVDAAAFFLGSPLHAVYGALTCRAFDALGFDLIEGNAWIGAVTLVLLAAGWRRLRTVPEARPWRFALAIFGTWALGPYLHVLGVNLGLVLPQILQRFVPIAANARIPGRAMVGVSLAAAVLLALTLDRLGGRWSTGRKGLLLTLLLLDVAASPLPLYQPETNAVYARLRQEPGAGAVLELPIGLRDGFGETGRFDSRTLLWQTVHGRAMLGGFVARLPESVKQWYLRAPVVSSLLRLSDAGCPDTWRPPDLSRRETYDGLARASVRFVVLDRARASPRLLQYVASLPLVRVMTDGSRELYQVSKP